MARKFQIGDLVDVSKFKPAQNILDARYGIITGYVTGDLSPYDVEVYTGVGRGIGYIAKAKDLSKLVVTEEGLL